jgi:hypothetical protein
MPNFFGISHAQCSICRAAQLCGDFYDGVLKQVQHDVDDRLEHSDGFETHRYNYIAIVTGLPQKLPSPMPLHGYRSWLGYHSRSR